MTTTSAQLTAAAPLARSPAQTNSGRARDRINHLQVVVDANERAEIKRRAEAAGLSVSAYLRTAALNHRISSVLDHAAVGELVKVAGD